MENVTATETATNESNNEFKGLSEMLSKGQEASEKDEGAGSSPAKPSESSVTPPAGTKPAPKEDGGEVDWSKVPAHLHPFTKTLLEEKKAMKAQLSEKEKLLSDPRVLKLFAQKQAAEEPKVEQRQQEQLEKLDPQSEADLNKLKRMLGLDKLDGLNKTVGELQAQNAKLTEREETRLMDAEESELKTKAEGFGLDWDSEVAPSIIQWFKDNPSFQGLGPGTLKVAFNNIHAERIGEWSERAANLKLIKEQEAKRKGTTEKSATTHSKTSPKGESMEKFIARRAVEMGF